MMLDTIMSVLQHSKAFQATLQAQPQQSDLNDLCRLCHAQVADHPDMTLVCGQLLDRAVQASSLSQPMSVGLCHAIRSLNCRASVLITLKH